MSTMSKFIKAFDVSNKTHIEWLSHMCDVAESLNPEKPTNMMIEINKNPFGLKLNEMDSLDWPHIHFCLCAMYAKAVLKGKAFLPK
jgi:hypothetical protein